MTSARRSVLASGLAVLSIATLGCDELSQMASEEWEARGKPPKSASAPAGASASSKVASAAPPTKAPGKAAPQAPVAQAQPPSGITPKASLRSVEKLAGLEGGCGLFGSANGKVYGRASDCKHVLEVDPVSGKVEVKPLSKAILVRAVEGDAAYGCELGRSDVCHLLKTPLGGGKATFIADLPRAVDGSGQVVGGAMLVLTLKNGLSEGALSRLDLATGAMTEAVPRVGVGEGVLGPGAIYYEGALEPKDNVGSPSWGLWMFAAGAAPRSFGKLDVDGMAADDRYVYYVTANRELRRVAVASGTVEDLANIPAPERLESKLGVSPGVALTPSHVYVSTANAESCQIYRVAK